MPFKRIVNALAVSFGVFLINTNVVSAQLNLRPRADSGFGNLGNFTFQRLITGLIQIVLVIAALAFFFMLVLGGIRWILSGGDKAATESARGQVTAAVVGLAVVFVTWAIINLIENFFGVDLLELNIAI